LNILANFAKSWRSLGERGVKPETLPPAEDIAKLKRKMDSDAKQLLKAAKKSKK